MRKIGRRTVDAKVRGATMDIEHTIVLSRSVEKILAALIGALAIFLGYKLFAAPLGADGGGLIKVGEKLQIDISHVGPGVFFALFGAGLIGYTMVPVKREQEQATPTQRVRTSIQAMNDIWPATVDLTPINSPPCEVSVKRLAEMAVEIGSAPTDKQQKELAAALREARVSLMCRSWKDEWGRREAFVDWVYNYGEGDPPSREISRAVAVYRGSA
jgi:hypothetical protein